MGWGDVISIGLGLGNLAVNSSNAATLQQMKLQQANEALYREFIGLMRNGMFNLKQTAESVLAGEEELPLKAAGAMRILDYKLSSSGITPDLFTELSDKEYAAATAKLINSNSNRMYAALDIDGKQKADRLVEHLQRLADLQYYVEHADGASRLQATKSAAGVDNNTQKKWGLIAIGLILFSGLLMMVSAELGMLTSCVGWLAALGVLLSFAGKRQAANVTKKTIKELEDSIDLPRFYNLEQQFGPPDRAKQLQQESEQYVESFFGDYTLLQNGWRS